jgi:protein ImuB
MARSRGRGRRVEASKGLSVTAEEIGRFNSSALQRFNEPLFAALYLPDFELQAALRHAPELHQQPVALLDGEEAKATILQLTQSAANAGVNVGMTPSQGLARCLKLIIKARALGQEKIATEILLHHGGTLAPEIEATAPGVCTVHFTSPKNCRENIERVVRQLAQLQLTARVGLAATPDLSFLAACLAQPVLQIDDPQNFLASLPIEILRHLPQLCGAL